MRRLNPRRRRADAPRPFRRRRARDRHGRGVRSMLVPPDVPLHRTRTEAFDDLVLDVVEHLEPRWSEELSRIEFAVEDVPAIEGAVGPFGELAYDSDVIADGDIPLARVQRPDSPGSQPDALNSPGTLPRIVLYRRPLETRARDAHDLAHLVHDVVVEQVAHVLGLSPDDVDGPGH